MPFRTRLATTSDRDAVLATVRAAFGHNDSQGTAEIDVVRRTWDLECADTVELVATDDSGSVIGHVLSAPGSAGGTPVPAIAPLCVHPSWQAKGVGAALMADLLRRLTDRGESLVLLLGDPAYYRRFGFVPAAEVGLTYSPVGAASPYFQACRLAGTTPRVEGEFRYCWEPSVG